MDSFKIFIESIGKFSLIFFLEWQEHDGHGTGALASHLDLRGSVGYGGGKIFISIFITIEYRVSHYTLFYIQLCGNYKHIFFKEIDEALRRETGLPIF